MTRRIPGKTIAQAPNVTVMEDKEVLFDVIRAKSTVLSKPVQFNNYTVLFIATGSGTYHADFGAFPFTGPVLLFSTPLQQIYIEQDDAFDITLLQFHGDFYCIEYHWAEVSCNGLLFNNCYLQPSVDLSVKDCALFESIIEDLEQEFSGGRA